MNVAKKAFAKINLTLDVFGKRADGFHDIASIFQTISLADDVNVTITGEPGVEIEVDGPLAAGVPRGVDNLASRAAAELLATIEPDAGALIRLTKRIPSQAGLGGGSSDAAAVLSAVANMLGVDVSSPIVTEIARRLGADVTFFLTGGTARVTGIGEIVEPLSDVDRFGIVIAKPSVGVSTARAYADVDAAADRISAGATAKWPSTAFANDFEPVVYAAYPAVRDVRDALVAAGCRSVTLCGSGSAVFGVCDDPESMCDAVIATGIDQVWAAHTVGTDLPPG